MLRSIILCACLRKKKAFRLKLSIWISIGFSLLRLILELTLYINQGEDKIDSYPIDAIQIFVINAMIILFLIGIVMLSLMGFK